RVIAATNADLAERVASKQFRDDLYYRLNVLPIAMPGLVERRGDIPELVESFAAEASRRHKLPALGVSRSVALMCREASWPGHVRQLANAIEAAVIRASGEHAKVVELRHVFPETVGAEHDDRPATFQDATRHFQRNYVLDALERNDWNVAETARRIGLARSYLYNLIHDFALRRDPKG